MSNLTKGATVIVTKAHNQFSACSDTKYQVGAINRVCGQYMALLTINGTCKGAIPERNLAVK